MTNPSVLLTCALALVLLYIGISRSLKSSDELWEAHKYAMLARGLAPERNAVWEENSRAGAWISIAVGLVCLFVSLMFASHVHERPERMSGTTINGRQLTQAEWEACGQDPVKCTQYVFANPLPR